MVRKHRHRQQSSLDWAAKDMVSNSRVRTPRQIHSPRFAVVMVGLPLLILFGCGPLPFPLADAELEVMTTAEGVEFVRTPDVYFEDLPSWPYEPEYVEIDGLRQAYIDEGSGESGETVLLLHGQPSWSYLYRKMIPWLVDAGHRVIAMDHLGMGRSDKPIDLEYYSYLNHVDRLEEFIEILQLEDITLFVQDWGSLIGLQVVGTNPGWFSRVVVSDGALPVFEEDAVPFPLPEDAQAAQDALHQLFTRIPPQQPAFFDEDGNPLLEGNGAASFGNWIVYAQNDERFRASDVVEAMTYFPLSPAEEAAYDAPFPARITMAGSRSFPGLANTLGGVTDIGWAGLGSFEKPFLTIWAANDPGNLGTLEAQQVLIDHVPGAAGQNHMRLPEASHFLQDDQGAQIAQLINRFIYDTTEPDPVASIRDARYCEVLMLYGDGGSRIEVWNSYSFSNCPQCAWEEQNTRALRREFGALLVAQNGPRFLLPDQVKSLNPNADNEIAQLGEMMMFKVATIGLDDGGLRNFAKSYNPRAVDRDTRFIFFADDYIYTLTDPDGNLYAMQSYSHNVDSSLTYESLMTLGDRLNLPAGWSYEPILLTEDLILDAQGSTTVVPDDIGSVYQIVNVPVR